MYVDEKGKIHILPEKRRKGNEDWEKLLTGNCPKCLDGKLLKNNLLKERYCPDCNFIISDIDYLCKIKPDTQI